MSAFTYGREISRDGEETFRLRFNPCTREPVGWKEELYAAARAVASRTTKPLWVCSSGGIDSEVACNAFHDQKIPFSVLTLDYGNDANLHDIQYAVRWCEERGVTQKIVRLDIEEFIGSGLRAYERYPAVHPFRYIQIRLMELVEEMGGYAVLCSGEQIYHVDLTKPVITRKDLFLPFSNGNVVPLEWCKDNEMSHEPYFHFSTPELCLSYLRLPLVSFALDNPELVFRHWSNAYTFKRIVYQSIWTDLAVRYKRDGYEKVRPLIDASRERLKKRFAEQYVEHNISVPEFERQLTGISRVNAETHI